MAKKSKNNMIASVMTDAITDSTKQEELSSFSTVEDDKEHNNEIGTLSMLNSEQLEIKQDVKYDDCCDVNTELKRLFKENSDLIDKTVGYLNDIHELENKNAVLQTNYDDCLVKISELSFEIALLKTQLSEVGKNNFDPNAPDASNKPFTQPSSTSVPYNIYNKNGYNDWN